ncbi:hypothetical protein ACROYT_G032915 [Oculina patagonica]
MSEQTKPKKEQKPTRYKNTIHLWEFLLELLEDERYIPLISWTRKEEREFKIKRQEEVAKRWGRLKQRAAMNYDKLSRALRYYYQKGIIKKVQGQRLVYKFDKLPYVYKPVRYNWPWPPPSEENLKLDRPDIKPNRVSKTTQWPVMPVYKSEGQSCVLPQRAPTNQHCSCFECVPRSHAQTMCRSQIMFPPCTCIGSAVYGVRMLNEPNSVPVQVITRFV